MYIIEYETRTTSVEMGSDTAAWFSKNLDLDTGLLFVCCRRCGMDGYSAPQLSPRKHRQQTDLMSWIKIDEEEPHEHLVC